MKFEIKTRDVFDFEADADALVFPARRQPIRNIRGNVSDVRVSVYANGETLF